jgi:hypothetical protein
VPTFDLVEIASLEPCDCGEVELIDEWQGQQEPQAGHDVASLR